MPVFADTPWLNTPPNEEGQASLLRGIAVMEQAAFDAAFEKLVPAAHTMQSTPAVAASVGEPFAPKRSEPANAAANAKRFLLQVMNDSTVALALRIEAAKALLQHST